MMHRYVLILHAVQVTDALQHNIIYSLDVPTCGVDGKNYSSAYLKVESLALARALLREVSIADPGYKCDGDGDGDGERDRDRDRDRNRDDDDDDNDDDYYDDDGGGDDDDDPDLDADPRVLPVNVRLRGKRRLETITLRDMQIYPWSPLQQKICSPGASSLFNIKTHLGN